jgi:hypothetical protein
MLAESNERSVFMDHVSGNPQAKVRLISSRPGPNGTTKHEYEVKGVDLTTIEGHWAAVNTIRERLYRGHA